MRCICCNELLSDYESSLRHPDNLMYLDICTECLKDIPIAPIESKNNPPTFEDCTSYDTIEYEYEIKEIFYDE